jgi:serine/threonine-protein kinase
VVKKHEDLTPLGARRRAHSMRDVRAGAYRLEEEIARGGFGIVHRAVHEATGRAAAVKVMHAEMFSDPTATVRFEREAEVVLALRHPNLIDIFEYGRLGDGRPYIAMELLSGASLEHRLGRQGRLPVEEVLAILGPLASALDAAHRHAVVHRDIKPSNVFLCDDGRNKRVVLLDFGVAKLLDSRGQALTASRGTLGTVLYMAPEQLLGSPVDARADVYSLGALAYAMLTGQAPFGDRDTLVLSRIHTHARPQRPSTCAPIDPALDEPLLRALAREPSDRPATAEAFVASLAAATRAARAAIALPVGAIERPALAVHAEVLVAPLAIGEGDEALFADVEATLPLVLSELGREGLVAVAEDARHLLMVAPRQGDPTLAERVIEAARRAHRRFGLGPGRDARLGLRIAVHAGVLLTSAEGTLLGGGLLDAASWAPAAAGGVVASSAALEGLARRGRPVASAPGFFAMEP